jgi:hypothetical protein
MRKITVGLIVGVVALIAWTWKGQILSLFGGPIGSAELGPSFAPRDIVQVIITVLLLGSSLYVILSRKYSAQDQNWAYGTVGTLLGFWLKP